MTVHPLTDRLFCGAGMRLAHFNATEPVRGHRHESAHAFFLLSGGMAQGAGRREVQLAAGGARLSGADAVHDIDFDDEGCECLVLHFHDKRVRGSDFSHDARTGELALTIAQRATSAADAPLALLAAWEAASALRRVSTSVPCWLFEAHRRITSAAGAASVDATARAVGVSREHLARQYRRHYGIAPSQSRRLVQLARAASLMHEQASLAEIATEVGFFDQSHMTQAFRAGFGCAPAVFRSAID